MTSTPATASPDARARAVARSQNEAISSRQLIECGISRRAIARRVDDKLLFRVHRGVYLTAPPEAASRLALMSAAQLAAGATGVISDETAAELWELPVARCAELHVTVTAGNPGPRDGIRRHFRATLDPRDVRIRHGIRVTSPARAILDLAPRLTDEQCEELISHARVRRLCTLSDLHALLRRVHCRGATRLRRVLRSEEAKTLKRSKMERRLLRLITAARLPRPEVNVWLEGHEVDFLWRDVRLVVETDGYGVHGDRAAFERDRRRDAVLVAAGYRVIRISWRQIVEEPLTVIAQIARAMTTAAYAAA